MKLTHSLPFWIVLGASLLVLAVWLLSPNPAAPAVSLAPLPRPVANTAAPPTPPPAKKGRAASYYFHFTQQLQVAQNPPTQLELRGTWTEAELAQEAETTWAIGFIAQGAQGYIPALGELSEPFFVTLDRRGRPESIAFTPQTTARARRLAKILVAHTRATRPEGGAQSWSALEMDATGIYQAEYRAQDSRRWLREKNRYAQLFGAAREVEIQGQTEFTWGADHLLEQLKSDEKVFNRLAKSHTTATAQIQVRLQRQPEAPSADLGQLMRLYRSAQKESLVPGADRAEARRRTDEDIVQGASYDDLLEDLRVALGDPDLTQKQDSAALVMRKLSALLRLQPELAADVGQQILAPQTTLDEANVLAGSLASAPHPAAVRALEKVVAEAPDGAFKTQALMSLALNAAVDEKTVDILKTTAQEAEPAVKNSALLALGAAGRHLGQGSQVVEELIAQYQAATNPEEKQLFLDALANSGDARILPLLQAALVGGDLEQMVQAAYGARFVAGPQADIFLQNILAEHPLAPVRLAALRAVGFRDLNFWRPTLETLWHQETEPQLRAALAEILAPEK